MKLRHLSEEHLDEVLKWRNHPQVRNSMISSKVISKSDHYEWFNSIKDSQKNFWYMYQNSGIIYFNLIEDNIAEWGFYKSPFEKKPIGLNMGYEGIEHAFKNLNLKTIIGLVLCENNKSCRFHEKLGFLKVGNERVQNKKCFRYELFSKEWLNRRESILRRLS